MKILIIGHGRHGKDTVAEMISRNLNMTFASSSLAAAKIFIYDRLKDKYGYKTFEECYTDRHNRRAEWHNLIYNYNSEDRARLAKEIVDANDMYVGMRSDDEFNECMKQGVFDIVIGVFDPEKPLEPEDSFDIDLFGSVDIMFITGELDETERKVKRFCDLLTM